MVRIRIGLVKAKLTLFAIVVEINAKNEDSSAAIRLTRRLNFSGLKRTLQVPNRA